MFSTIRQFHDGMRACVQLDNRVCSGRFALEQGLCQGCVLAPLLFAIFLVVVINVAYTRFKVDDDIMDALMHLRKKTGSEEAGGDNHGRVCPGDVAFGACFMRLCRSCLAIARAADRDVLGYCGRVRGGWLYSIGGHNCDHMITHKWDVGVHRLIRRRGSGLGVQPNKRVRVSRGECQPQCCPAYHC